MCRRGKGTDWTNCNLQLEPESNTLQLEKMKTMINGKRSKAEQKKMGEMER